MSGSPGRQVLGLRSPGIRRSGLLLLVAGTVLGSQFSVPGSRNQERGTNLSDRITTDYYEVRVTPYGTLDVYALTGREIAADLPRFDAKYSISARYVKVAGDVVTFPVIEEHGDSILITSQEDLGPVEVTYRYALCRLSPIIECRVRLYYPRMIDSVFSELLELPMYEDSCRVLTRDQRFVPARPMQSYVSDKWTTRAASFGLGAERLTLIGEDNLMGMRLNRDFNRWLVVYDIDREFDHPFIRNWDYPPYHEVYETLATTARKAGGSSEFFFRFAVGKPVPVIKRERQPDGCQATFVITEHADCDGPLTTKAIAYGSCDSDTPLIGRGILGNGLTWTKTVFRWHTYGTRTANLGYYGLDRPDHKAVIDSIYRRGVEIGLHTPTALADSAETVAVALRDMANWYHNRVWIDHAMDVNKEDVSKFGTYPESTAWYIIDTLHANGIDYVWQSIDLTGIGGSGHNLLMPASTSFYPPLLYPQPRLNSPTGRSFYLWPAFPLGGDQDRDNHISPGGINQLIDERGIDVMHVYFSAQDTYVSRLRPCYANWLIHRGSWPYVRWESDHWVDACLQYIADRKQNGLLRVPTLSQYAEYLLQSDSVELRALDNRSFLLINHSRQAIPGFALSVAGDGVEEIAIAGQPVRHQKPVADDILFWFDMPPDTTLQLSIRTRDYLNDEDVTAPPPNAHLRYRAGVTWRVLQFNSEIVGQFSADNGVTWSEAESLGPGFDPALALNPSGNPLVSYDSSGVPVIRWRTASGEWRKAPIAFDTASWSLTSSGALTGSIVEDDSLGPEYYFLYCARRKRAPQECPTDQTRPASRTPAAVSGTRFVDAPVSLRLMVFDTTRMWLDTMIANGAFGGDCAAPGLALTPADYLHFTWQQGPDSMAAVCYRATTLPFSPIRIRRGIPPLFGQTLKLAAPAQNPVVSTWGDSVFVWWQEQVESSKVRVPSPGPSGFQPSTLNSQHSEIRRRSHWLPADYANWAAPENVSRSPDCPSRHPQAENQVCVWEEEIAPGNTDIKGIAGDLPITVAATPGPSLYPQMNLQWENRAPYVSLAALWTEAIPSDSLWYASFTRVTPAMTALPALYSVVCGESTVSPYCWHRSRSLGFPGHRVDAGYDYLEYGLPWLNPDQDCRILCRFAAPLGDTLTQNLYLNDSLVGTVQAIPLVTDTAFIIVPSLNYRQTGLVSLRIMNPAGPVSVCEGISPYQCDSSDVAVAPGAAQGNSSGILQSAFRIAILSSNPGPAPFLFRCQFSKPGPASLTVYSAAGRLIRSLSIPVQKAASTERCVFWDGRDGHGVSVPAGVYISRLTTSNAATCAKVVLLR